LGQISTRYGYTTN
jgi:predicted MFS family arabinose efflux permease